MFPFKVFIFLLTIYVAKSEVDLCKNDYRDENSNQIDVLEYCSNKLCIEKCCGPGEMIRSNNICTKKTEWFAFKNITNNGTSLYNSINILSSRDVNKKSEKNIFVYNHRHFQNCTAWHFEVQDYEISENGSLWWRDNVSTKWNQIEKLEYCIDYTLFPKTDKTIGIKIVIMESATFDQESEKIEAFEIPALLISSFFLVLVLVVYCLIPDLRNLTGLIMMAYTFSLLFAFVNKVILTFIKRDPPEGFCKQFTPVMYFAAMSSIFWLSAISFEVWWGLRSFRINRGSKRGELVKFMWYGLYAWGTPLLVTAIVTTLDNIAGLNLSVEPPFKNCFYIGDTFDYYLKIPIGILIFINIVLFVMTVYNLRMVEHNINKCQDSTSTKKKNYKFSTYAKLSVMMGLSWCLELLPSIRVLWFYILINLYNLLIGIAIFYWFVCKKKILVQLCKRFNIQNGFIKKLELELSQHNKSGITRTTGVASSIVKNRSKDQNPEIELEKLP